MGTLQSLNRLSDVGTDVIRRSQANTVADLRALQPILRNLVEAGDALPGSLQILLTIPFADNSLNVIKGDFANIDVTLDLDLQAMLGNILNAPRSRASTRSSRCFSLPARRRCRGDRHRGHGSSGQHIRGRRPDARTARSRGGNGG